MPAPLGKIGIVGGTGMLGRSIARGLLDRGGVAPGDLWLSNRTGTAGELDLPEGVTLSTDSQALADACGIIVLSVPPAMAPALALAAPDRLVISVMAGVQRAALARITGAARVVRAMSSPAATHGLAFSPWIASDAVTAEDRARVITLFESCGTTAEVTDEDQIDVFTALTGPVPGFVALFADCLARYATDQGVAPPVADQAVRQLFLAAGRMMAEGAATPAEHVQEMLDYAGTTAAGLAAMRALPLQDHIARGLDAAVARARQIAEAG